MPLVFDVAAELADSMLHDLSPFSENDLVPAKVVIGECDVVQAHVVALAVVPRVIIKVKM